MKKYIYLLLITLVSLYGCQKNDIINEYKTISVDTEYQTNKKSVSVQNITTFEDLIKFKSEKDFENAYKILRETQIEELKGFNNKYLKYSQEELEELSEVELEKISFEMDNISSKENFKEDGIYERFEKQLNFYSLRAELDKKHTLWLSNTNLNWDENPLDNIIPIPSLQTFYNQFNEIMIGNTVYKTNSNGITFKIANATYEQILDLRKNYDNYKNYKNIELYGAENSNQTVTNESGTSKTNLYGCEMNKRDFDFHEFNSIWTPVATYANRFAIGIADGGIWHTTFAKNSHYKRINSVWKLTTTSWLQVWASSELYRFWSCDQFLIINQSAYNGAGAAKVIYCDEVTFGESWQLMQSTKTHETYGRYYSHGQYFTFWLEW